METDTLKLKLIESVMAEDWCAVLLWAKVGETVNLDGDANDILAMVAEEENIARTGLICWKCVDACNDIKRELEG